MPQHLSRPNQTGRGQRSIVSTHNRIIKAMAADEFKRTGKITRTQLVIQHYRARDAAWLAELKKRNSWRFSQGLGPYIPPKAKDPALDAFIGK